MCLCLSVSVHDTRIMDKGLSGGSLFQTQRIPLAVASPDAVPVRGGGRHPPIDEAAGNW